MKLLESKKMNLPTIYFINDREDIKDIPIGVPFMYGDPEVEDYLVRILEYETLYQEALKTGYPFDFKQILLDNGYRGLKAFSYSHPVYMEFATDKGGDDFDVDKLETIQQNSDKFKRYIKDSAVYVDVTKLKALNVFPVWLDKIEQAIHTNIHNFAVFNNNMYNKKLEGMYGGLDLVSPNKNLIIIDISGSIPKGVSSTILALAKNLAETFYSDLIITGSKSTLYAYEEIQSLDVEAVYDENEMDNDQVYFRKLVSGDERHYKTAIVFGDNHSPSYPWSNPYNRGSRSISRADGKALCKWKIDKLISFHTENAKHTAGYADWFEPEETEKIKNWVKYLNN